MFERACSSTWQALCIAPPPPPTPSCCPPPALALLSFRARSPLARRSLCSLPRARSLCGWSQCGATFTYSDPVVLRRLRDVPDLLNALPFDPEFPWSDVSLDRSFTSAMMYDTVTRQGVANTIDKITKVGAESVQRRAEMYAAVPSTISPCAPSPLPALWLHPSLIHSVNLSQITWRGHSSALKASDLR